MSSQPGNSTSGKGPDRSNQSQQNVASTTPQTPDKQGGPQSPQNTRSLKQKFNQFKPKFLHFVDKYSYILVPLPFAILIFFFTLIISMHKQVYLPLLPFAIFLLGLAGIQGALLYFVSTLSNTSYKETYWNLTVILGFAIFLVVGTLEVFGFGAGVFLLILFLLIGTVLARRSIHLVQEGSIDIVTAFGKYVRTLPPGLYLLMPWEKTGVPLNTKETPWKFSDQVKIAQGDEVKLTATIWYQLDSDSDRAHIADLNVVNWETSLREMFVSTLKNVFREVTRADIDSWYQGTHVQISQAQTVVDINTIDASTKTSLDRISDTIKTRVQQDVNNWGVKIHKVDIQDITKILNLTPRANPIIRPVSPAPGPTSGGNPTEAQPQQGSVPPDQQTTLPLQPPYGSAYTLTSPPIQEMLKEAFEAVRTGRVKDPQTIRDIAARFEAHTYDPSVDFDPIGAADILYRRARLYEQLNDQKSHVHETVHDEKDHTHVAAKEEKVRTSVTVDEENGRASVTVHFRVQPDIKVNAQTSDLKYGGG